MTKAVSRTKIVRRTNLTNHNTLLPSLNLLLFGLGQCLLLGFSLWANREHTACSICSSRFLWVPFVFSVAAAAAAVCCSFGSLHLFGEQQCFSPFNKLDFMPFFWERRRQAGKSLLRLPFTFERKLRFQNSVWLFWPKIFLFFSFDFFLEWKARQSFASLRLCHAKLFFGCCRCCEVLLNLKSIFCSILFCWSVLFSTFFFWSFFPTVQMATIFYPSFVCQTGSRPMTGRCCCCPLYHSRTVALFCKHRCWRGPRHTLVTKFFVWVSGQKALAHFRAIYHHHLLPKVARPRTQC